MVFNVCNFYYLFNLIEYYMANLIMSVIAFFDCPLFLDKIIKNYLIFTNYF